MYNLYKNNKGQASAPFEVLVAIILMGFVILAGTWALSNLSENTCLGNKRQKMGELKEGIKEVVLGYTELTYKLINFQVTPCFNQKYEYITLKTYADTTRCNAYCGGGSTCTLLEYVYDDGKTRRLPIPPVCVELPTSYEVADLYECFSEEDPEKDNWDALNSMDLASNIPSGKYRLYLTGVSSGSVGETSQLCFLKRKK